MTDQIISELFDNFYNEFLSGINSPEVAPQDLVALTVNAMKIVEKNHSLSGADKKQYVIDIISKFVNDSSALSPQYKADADAFIRSTLPELIDQIVAVYEHEVELKKSKKQQGCCIIS
jgi:hypothetical protein